MPKLDLYLCLTPKIPKQVIIIFCNKTYFRDPNFTWSYDHDILMCWVALDIEPYQRNLRSPERGKAWETISSRFNASSCPNFRVKPRSVPTSFPGFFLYLEVDKGPWERGWICSGYVLNLLTRKHRDGKVSC